MKKIITHCLSELHVASVLEEIKISQQSEKVKMILDFVFSVETLYYSRNKVTEALSGTWVCKL